MSRLSARVRTSFNWNNFTNKKFLQKANYRALEYISNEMLQDVNQFVPRNTGRLRRNGKVVDLSKDGFSMEWHRRLIKNGKMYNNVAPSLYNWINPITNRPVHRWTTQAPDGSPAGGDWNTRAEEFYKDDWKKKYTKSFTESFRQHLK